MLSAEADPMTEPCMNVATTTEPEIAETSESQHLLASVATEALQL